MVNSIDQALVIHFREMVHLEAEQRKSRLRGKFLEKPVVGNQGAYERIDTNGLPDEITARHAKTIANEVAHSRREIKMRDFANTLLLDKFDDLQVIIDPQNQYASATVRKMLRQYDKIVIDAATASVNTGRNFGTTVTAATDGVTTIAAGGTGLTYTKLLEVKQTFINAEVGVDDDEDIFLLVTGQQHTDMMEEVELTSGDFVRGKVVDDGLITSALGMRVILFGTSSGTNFIPITGTERDCLAMSSRAVCVGINMDIEVDVDKRPDLNNAQQVQARFFLGGTRTEGALVQVVTCDEA